eukprot:TRINITY_DN18866_c0_g1_i2.p2 TRINITY_DN18866_c0_g1~~TRINITY_DN18866_c0_g1_i2.p2  ORF type:complete len:339 (+),score=38.77 TRINITY_DN18866_c0_g1_i2:73-1017(+)
MGPRRSTASPRRPPAHSGSGDSPVFTRAVVTYSGGSSRRSAAAVQELAEALRGECSGQRGRLRQRAERAGPSTPLRILSAAPGEGQCSTPPTAEGLLDAARWLADGAAPGDRLLYALGGIGFMLQGLDDAEPQPAVAVTADPSGLVQMLSVAHLAKALSQVPEGVEVLVVADTVFPGRVGDAPVMRDACAAAGPRTAWLRPCPEEEPGELMGHLADAVAAGTVPAGPEHLVIMLRGRVRAELVHPSPAGERCSAPTGGRVTPSPPHFTMPRRFEESPSPRRALTPLAVRVRRQVASASTRPHRRRRCLACSAPP